MNEAGYADLRLEGAGHYLLPEKLAGSNERLRETLFATRRFVQTQVRPRTQLCLLDGGFAEPMHGTLHQAWTLKDTDFFGDAASFELLRTRILPELIAKRRTERRLRIWSAATSTGQEAYSVAMLLLEHFPEVEGWDVKIVGTDMRGLAIDRAVRGRYRRREVECGLAPAIRAKYFLRMGDEWEVTPRLRALCEFRQADLCAMLPDLEMFDAVLLRNVVLYLAPAQRGGVFAGIHRRMRGDGYCMLDNAGHAEDWTELFEAEFADECPLYRPVAA